MADTAIERPDAEQILQTLKPFQRDTVEYVFRRLYTDPDYTRRFLIADEVGLGKTMVARGLIARAIEHLESRVDRIDIVYICSNGDIARQNLKRLQLTSDGDTARVGRLTMLPAVLPQLDSRLNFVAFTPGTSFNLGASAGQWQERALLYWMLEDLGRLPTGARGSPRNQGAAQLLQAGVSNLKSWKRRLRERHLPGIGTVTIEPSLLERFSEALQNEAERARGHGRPDLQARIDDACARLKGRNLHSAPWDLWNEARAITGELRTLLARSCMQALEPDLLILDEFQRFKELLDPENEAGELAHDLFDYADADTAVRTVLLSATPYKMYTLHDESDEDDHYRDFMQTLDFLHGGGPETAEIEALFKRMRRALYRIPSDGPDEALESRQALEQRMRRVMVRTERASGTQAGDDMVTEQADLPPAITATDAARYLALQRVIRAADGTDMVEYWKSAPYLLNFMDDYKPKQLVEQTLDAGGSELARELRRHSNLLLSQQQIAAYQEVDPMNSRLELFIRDIVDRGMWRMLWMPPSLAPYHLSGPYADADVQRITKRLIFSAWQVVPKTIAALVSYEIERRLHTRFDEAAENTQKARDSLSHLLRLNRADEGERLAGLPLFTLLYPSSVLARIGHEALAAAAQEAGEDAPSQAAVLEHAREAIRSVLPLEVSERGQEGRPDEAWYWIAPILLDLHDEPDGARAWWDRQELAYVWAGEGREGQAAGWHQHLDYAWEVVQGRRPDGPPPADLVDLLAEIAIAGPATCALRSLRAVTAYDGQDTPQWLRDGAARIGWVYRRLFNQVESSVLIRGEYQGEETRPYWREILRYALDGGLTAVSDEYFHVLAESVAASTLTPDVACGELVKEFEEAVPLPASRVEWDEIQVDRAVPEVQRNRLRTHFAVRFGRGVTDDGSTETREDQVRAAFNSPFWPFVLSSTSIGQEGLDFHQYCHAIVHWNLPPNPVDMEQREGRIHRYKGHAVRKNVANRFSAEGRVNGHADRWRTLFARARAEQVDGSRGLVPDWTYPGPSRIERHVPVLPFSRDALKYEHLRRSLAAYRMVFGQARQEDLMAYLLKHVGANQIEGLASDLRIDLSPSRLQPSPVVAD